MSLQVDGTWKGGVWAATVWLAGVWLENAPAAAPPAPAAITYWDSMLAAVDVPKRKRKHPDYMLLLLG